MDKITKYQQTANNVNLYLKDYEIDTIGKMSMIASMLINAFPEWIFCGFYRKTFEKQLEIGPYQSSIIPCGQIDFSRGVCGKSARTQKTVIVDNVMNFPGYISCDDKTVSEIVIPVVKNGELLAVLDIDGAIEGQFDKIDQKYLEIIVNYI